ncbi:unnamed protein product [Clonostachys byssicola]|uniref:Uncharacterized protein n=1 Tax=Clonostachys byssicola TaxID=160290 RepID=A0A9N9Y2R9_9HYPO|nr:unnamed protein product [Clonostachys byssicola]
MDNPNAQVPFLRMHSFVFKELADWLPDHTKVLLSQTCRGIRTMLQINNMVPALSASEHVRLLVQHARSNAKVWVCAGCKKRHRITKRDFMQPRGHPSCPYRKSSRPGEEVSGINYARVQLALKYNRLAAADDSLRHYLNKLRSYEADNKVVRHKNSFEIFEWFSSPRVVDARFLMHYRWEFRMHGASYTPSVFPRLKICNHQRLRRPADGVAWCDQRKQLFWVVVKAMLFSRKGEEWLGNCPFCPTDFAVRSFDNGMRIDAWKDFGPEDGPGNPTWMSHYLSEAQRTPSDRGSVRRLYDSYDEMH